MKKYVLGLTFILTVTLAVFFLYKSLMFPTVSNVQIEGLGEVTVGEILLHQKFGEGKLKQIQVGDGGVLILELEFPEHGTKFLVADYANLKKT